MLTEPGVLTLLFSAGWVVANLMSFVIWFRRRAVVRSEKGILLYHVYSFGAMMIALLGVVLTLAPPTSMATPIAALALHGIYSMTFLVLWGSSDSGVSLRMLAVLQDGPLARAELQSQFVRMGDAKRDSRLPALERAGFVRRLDERYAAASRGRLMAFGLQLLQSINNFGSMG
jgi:hypothetical protein